MNALLNAHTKRGCDSPPHIGFASNVSPEAQSSQTGVSSEYVQQEGYNWFVLRATYNRVNAAVEKAKKNDIKTYVPMHYVLKVIAGKKKRIQQPLLPNFLFRRVGHFGGLDILHGETYYNRLICISL